MEISIQQLVPALEKGMAEVLSAETRKLNLEIERLELENRSVRHQVRTEEAASNRALRYTFYNPVVPQTVLDCISSLDVWSRREPGAPFEIIFNSPGGGVTDGLALFDFIQELRHRGHRVTTKCFGQAASMGAILMQAGDERVMTANAFMMIHAPSMYYAEATGRTSHVLEDELDTLKLYQRKGSQILASRSKLDEAEIEKRWKKTDWYIDAAQALELGLIDRID